MAMKQAKVEYYESEEGGEQPWRFRVKARNGEIVAHGESYGSEADAVRGFMAAYRAVSDAFYVEVGEDEAEQEEPDGG